MAVTRSAFLAVARTWLKTKWLHQGDVKGRGCDCLGLIRGVCIETGLVPPDWKSIEGVQELLGYGRLPFRGTLERVCDRFLVRISEQDALPADVVVMKFGGEAHHMAILGDYQHGGLSIIHAYAAQRMVVEARLDDQMRARICRWYRIPGIEA
jgi:cell wall-associated NlpC family hydrolase